MGGNCNDYKVTDLKLFYFQPKQFNVISVTAMKICPVRPMSPSIKRLMPLLTVTALRPTLRASFV